MLVISQYTLIRRYYVEMYVCYISTVVHWSPTSLVFVEGFVECDSLGAVYKRRVCIVEQSRGGSGASRDPNLHVST